MKGVMPSLAFWAIFFAIFFRNPKYLERYEDFIFNLEQALDVLPANNAHQNKTGLRFVTDNTGEATPFDWYNARLSIR